MVCLLSSCVNDVDLKPCEDNIGGTVNNIPECYIQLNINFPTEVSSRSTTLADGSGNSFDGTKDAIAAENAINSLHLYFFDNSNSTDKGKFLCELSASATDLTDGDDVNQHTFTQKVEIANLKKILGKKVRIYAIANLNAADYPTVTSETSEAVFLDKYYESASYTGTFAVTSGSTTTYGRNCPMANYDYFTGNLEGCSIVASNASDLEVITEAMKIFTHDYTGTDGKPGKLFTFSGALELERMVARLDFKAADGITINGTKNYVYELPNAECTITDCNSSNGGVYLQLADLTVNKITGSAYNFRHTAAGNSLAAGTPLKVFGKENVDGSTDTPSGADVEDEDGDGEGNEETPELPSYNWIASHKWTSSRSYTSSDPFTPSEICAWLTSGDSYVEKTEGYSPWYYVNENTVSSTADMDLDHCTYIEFKFLLWDAKTKEPYMKPTVSGGSGEDTQAEATADTEEEVRITMTGGDKNGYYRILDGPDAHGYYYLIYKYMIPHHLPTSSGSVDGETGSLTGTKAPMQYGVVRNNVYQIGFNGLTSLPSPHEPDNFYLSINIKILAWVKRDITVSW